MSNRRFKGFTLAEVLITLGVIGIVAAMTMPALIAKHQKHVVANQVKKFYSAMSQAVNLSVAEYGSMEDWDGFTTKNNIAELEHWFDKYLKPYMKTVDEYIAISDTGKEYFTVSLSDGSVFTMFNWAGSLENKTENYNGLIHVDYYTNVKYLKKGDKYCVNRFTFLFYNDRQKKYYFQPYSWGLSTEELNNRDSLLSKMSYSKQYCSALIVHDNWEIKDDYPWK